MPEERLGWRGKVRETLDDEGEMILLVAIVVLICLAILTADAWLRDGGVAAWWAKWADPVVGMLTLFIAIGLWVRNKVAAWEENLPHLLDVDFIAEGEKLLSIHHAPLSGPSDIRTYSQALGKAANEGGELDLIHNNTILGPEIVRVGSKPYKLWKCICPLGTRPTGFGAPGRVLRFAPQSNSKWQQETASSTPAGTAR